jgi:uncharacterized paraquat-inducible protein A
MKAYVGHPMTGVVVGSGAGEEDCERCRYAEIVVKKLPCSRCGVLNEFSRTEPLSFFDRQEDSNANE